MQKSKEFVIGDRVLTRCHGWGKVVGKELPYSPDYPMGEQWLVQLEPPRREEVCSPSPLLDFRYALTVIEIYDYSKRGESEFFRHDEGELAKKEFDRWQKTEGSVVVVILVDRQSGQSAVKIVNSEGVQRSAHY